MCSWRCPRIESIPIVKSMKRRIVCENMSAKILSGLQTGNNRNSDYTRKLWKVSLKFRKCRKNWLENANETYNTPRVNFSIVNNHTRLSSCLLFSIPRMNNAVSFISFSLGFRNSAMDGRRISNGACSNRRSLYRGHR